MLKNFKVLSPFVGATLLVFGLAAPVFAQTGRCSLRIPGLPVRGIVSPTDLCKPVIGQIISAFLPAILGIAGFITVIIIAISGIQFIASSGNPEAAAAARGRLIFALVGFALIILAFSITQIIDRLFLNSGAV